MSVKLYKRNQKGNPIFWEIGSSLDFININSGTIGGATMMSSLPCSRADGNIRKEIESKTRAKLKEGYKTIESLADNTRNDGILDLANYLNTYLPKLATTDSGFLKPMLAKTFVDGKVSYPRIVQPKINGERCTISAIKSGGIFSEYKLLFKSREGNVFNVSPILSKYIFSILTTSKFLDKMIEQDWELDGELYIPGLPINEINSAIKNSENPRRGDVRFWCYDLLVENLNQSQRNTILYDYFNTYTIANNIDTLLPDLNTVRARLYMQHYTNNSKFVLLPNIIIYNDKQAIGLRDTYINAGFEGIILRDPNGEYQFGKRNNTMIKYKQIHECKCIIVDIIPEGVKRNLLPKFILRNDINEHTFEATIKGSFEGQEIYLKDKDRYIGMVADVEYRERSGVDEVPFHAKISKIV